MRLHEIERNSHEAVLPIGQKMVPIRPPSDDVDTVASSNYDFWTVAGTKLMPTSSLHGGVSRSDPQQRRRIDGLKSAIMMDGGYISRLIVDQHGNVIEGQHRLEALRDLGSKKAPVQMIVDLADGRNIAALENVVRNAQHMHREQARQLIGDVLEGIHGEGSVNAYKDTFDPPQGYETAWNALLAAIAW